MTKSWSRHQEVITRLYKEENRPLREVMRIMKEEYGFEASTRAYRTRFDIWGLSKYNRQRRRNSAAMQWSPDAPAAASYFAAVGSPTVQVSPPPGSPASSASPQPLSPTEREWDHERKGSTSASLAPMTVMPLHIQRPTDPGQSPDPRSRTPHCVSVSAPSLSVMLSAAPAGQQHNYDQISQQHPDNLNEPPGYFGFVGSSMGPIHPPCPGGPESRYEDYSNPEPLAGEMDADGDDDDEHKVFLKRESEEP